MTWRAIFETPSGKLVSIASVWTAPTPPGLDFVEYAERPDVDGVMWDEATTDWVPRPPKIRIDRMDDLEAHPTFLQFQQVFDTLTNQQKAKVRNAIRMMLGTEQFRNVTQGIRIGE